jgi:hypothetical protein
VADFKTNLAADFSVFTSDLSVTVTYKRRTGSAFDPSTGVETPTFASTSVTAVRQGLSTRMIAVSGGLYAHGDVIFFVKVAELDAQPKREDQVAYGDDTYEIRDWDLEEDENVYRIVARRL